MKAKTKGIIIIFIIWISSFNGYLSGSLIEDHMQIGFWIVYIMLSIIGYYLVKESADE